jgi:hypothetical protein
MPEKEEAAQAVVASECTEPVSTDAEKSSRKDNEAAAKDSRSFEERIAALNKPAVVEQPNEEKMQADLTILKEKLSHCDQRLVRQPVFFTLDVIFSISAFSFGVVVKI